MKSAAHEPAHLELAGRAQEQPVVALARLLTQGLQDFQDALARNDGHAFQLPRVGGQRLRNSGAHPVIVGTPRDVDEAADDHGVAGLGGWFGAQAFAGSNCRERLTQPDSGLKPIVARAREHSPDQPFERRQPGIA